MSDDPARDDAAGTAAGEATGNPAAGGAAPRPMIERLGLAAIAVVIAGLFGTVAGVTLANGEIFLGVMAATGAFMTVWAALGTLKRG